ncbi:unnamed protein product [Lathyrus sativus]|nr:unnamed protein product [Lathyrus sativus]
MKFQSFVLLLLLILLASFTVNKAIPGGGWTPIKDITNIHYIKIARFAVIQYDKQEGATFEFKTLIKGEYQSFSVGTNFRLTLTARNGSSSSNYEAVVWEPAFGLLWKLTSFKHV